MAFEFWPESSVNWIAAAPGLSGAMAWAAEPQRASGAPSQEGQVKWPIDCARLHVSAPFVDLL